MFFIRGFYHSLQSIMKWSNFRLRLFIPYAIAGMMFAEKIYANGLWILCILACACAYVEYKYPLD